MRLAHLAHAAVLRIPEEVTCLRVNLLDPVRQENKIQFLVVWEIKDQLCVTVCI
jgi:hypothetical protein